MSGDVTYGALERLTHMPNSQELNQGDAIAGQKFDNVYFVGGSISNTSIDNLPSPLSIANGGTGQNTANAALNAFLPTQTGNGGKYLQTDGTNTSWQTAGGGSVPTQITVANEAADTSCFVCFFTAATGDLGPKTNAGLTFNSATGIFSATGFAGPLTGNVTGNVSGSSGSTTGNAATATALQNARTIGGVSFDGTANIVPTTIVVADTTDTTCFVGLWESATGDLLPKTDAGITYNAATGQLNTTLAPTVNTTGTLVNSDPTGVTGADKVINIMSLTQSEYSAIGAPNASTLYIITDA